MRNQKTEVLIVGAGPVGLFAATRLAQHGINTYVVDEEWRGTGFSYALGLHPESVELLEALELAEPLMTAAYPVKTMAFYEGTDLAIELDLTTVGGKYPFLTILPQNRLEAALEGWLKQHKTKIHWKHRVTEIEQEDRPIHVNIERWGEDMTGYAVAHKVRVIEKAFPLQAEFILGADGHKSLVRRRLDLNYDTLSSELYGVFEFQSQVDLNHTARIILDENLTTIIWPMPDGRCRWSFQLEDDAEFSGDREKSRSSELGQWITPGLEQHRLETLLAERAPWFKGTVEELFWSVPIRFDRKLASDFGRGGLWLAGDSAHLAGPAGVQSMNVGLREACDLADSFKSILRDNADASCLETYRSSRSAEWRELLNTGGALRSGDKATAFVRKNAQRILGCIPASGASLHGLMGQLGLEFGDP